MGHINSYDEFLADLPEALDLYGTRTVEGSRYLGPKDACDQIRKDLKLATVSGVLPAGVKLSIRRNDHNSIYVEIVTWPGQILTTEYELYYRDQIVTPDSSKSWDRYRDRPFGTRCWNDRCVDALNDAMRFIERVSNRHNFDKSDIQTDHFHARLASGDGNPPRNGPQARARDPRGHGRGETAWPQGHEERLRAPRGRRVWGVGTCTPHQA